MTPAQISACFREARLHARALPAYPGGAVPADLDSAYAIQDMSIAAWPGQVCGWKVALIQPAWQQAYPADRYAGPVFANGLQIAGAEPSALAVIDGGGAAVEAEFALHLASDIPANAIGDDPRQLLPYVGAVHAAIELAGSPLAGLSALGPGAAISDFGNNSGLLVGPRLPDGILDGMLDGASDMATVTEINGQVAGKGGAMRIPGGPLAALGFLVRQLASRGMRLKAGDWVSTGATTGIHPVAAGDRVLVRFGEALRLDAVISKAEALG